MLTSLGVVAYCFEFEFKGLTGLLLKDKSVVPYSFYGIGTTIPAASGDITDPAPYVIQFFYYMFGLVVPLALSVLMACLWVVPTSYR